MVRRRCKNFIWNQRILNLMPLPMNTSLKYWKKKHNHQVQSVNSPHLGSSNKISGTNIETTRSVQCEIISDSWIALACIIGSSMSWTISSILNASWTTYIKRPWTNRSALIPLKPWELSPRLIRRRRISTNAMKQSSNQDTWNQLTSLSSTVCSSWRAREGPSGTGESATAARPPSWGCLVRFSMLWITPRLDLGLIWIMIK